MIKISLDNNTVISQTQSILNDCAAHQKRILSEINKLEKNVVADELEHVERLTRLKNELFRTYSEIIKVKKETIKTFGLYVQANTQKSDTKETKETFVEEEALDFNSIKDMIKKNRTANVQ